MSEDKLKNYNELVSRFIQLANQMKDEGKSINMVNASLMSASGVYATYTAVGGDEGGLTPSGVKQVASVYKENLENVQKMKLSQSEKT